jgi:type II secretory pathway pseudopilin PulG
MRIALLVLVSAAAVPALAENTLTDRDRQALAQQQQIRQAQIERARGRCVEQRGTGCDTIEGLREWMMLDRTREEAVLDQVRLPGAGPETVPSSGSGATTPAPTR